MSTFFCARVPKMGKLALNCRVYILQTTELWSVLGPPNLSLSLLIVDPTQYH